MIKIILLIILISSAIAYSSPIKPLEAKNKEDRYVVPKEVKIALNKALESLDRYFLQLSNRYNELLELSKERPLSVAEMDQLNALSSIVTGKEKEYLKNRDQFNKEYKNYLENQRILNIIP